MVDRDSERAGPLFYLLVAAASVYLIVRLIQGLAWIVRVL